MTSSEIITGIVGLLSSGGVVYMYVQKRAEREEKKQDLEIEKTKTESEELINLREELMQLRIESATSKQVIANQDQTIRRLVNLAISYHPESAEMLKQWLEDE